MVKNLPMVFDSSTVLSLSDEDLQRIAGEPTRNIKRRDELNFLIDALQTSLLKTSRVRRRVLSDLLYCLLCANVEISIHTPCLNENA